MCTYICSLKVILSYISQACSFPDIHVSGAALHHLFFKEISTLIMFFDAICWILIKLISLKVQRDCTPQYQWWKKYSDPLLK